VGCREAFGCMKPRGILPSFELQGQQIPHCPLGQPSRSSLSVAAREESRREEDTLALCSDFDFKQHHM